MKVDKAQDAIEDERDARLLTRAQSGDKDAFGELWQHYKARLHAASIRRTKRIYKLRASGQEFEKAEDIVNETFLIAWRTLDEIPSHVTFRMWLWGILRNVIRGQVALHERPCPFDPKSLEDIPEERSLHESRSDAVNSDSLLWKYISRLEPKYRRILEDHYFKEMTQEECGKKIKHSREIVRRRIACAIRKLRDEFEADGLSFGDF